jgi:hypothetical protein
MDILHFIPLSSTLQHFYPNLFKILQNFFENFRILFFEISQAVSDTEEASGV